MSNHRLTQNGSRSSLEAENEAREHALREKITALKNVLVFNNFFELIRTDVINNCFYFLSR